MSHFETLAIHGGEIHRSNTGDVTSPIHLSTTFFRGEDGGYPGGYMYSRMNNPNRASLEQLISKLELAEASCTFSSGNTAGMAVFQALKAGSHIIAPDDMYWGFKKQLLTIFADSLSFDFVDLSRSETVAQHIKTNTRLIWVESPSNPLLKITDIATMAELAKKHSIYLAVDNTFLSPVLQNPIALGADVVMHSSTKYLGGHSDVLGGSLSFAKKDDFYDRVKNIQETGGAVPSPFDCFMLLRSIKTLPYRMRGHCENAKKIVDFLKQHPKVEAVYYPGLAEHPQHEIAKKQMKDFGAMISFLARGGADEARKMVNKVQLFSQATSLGGVESLIEHRASIEGPNTTTPQNLIRLSIGLEHSDDLIADLEQALA